MTLLADTGVELLERGLPIIPCNGKVPTGGESWHKQKMTEQLLRSQLDQAKEPAIGLILGPKSGIIDVESDSEEEEILFKDLFEDVDAPVTPTYLSTRGPHRLFKWDERLAATGKAVINFTNGGSHKLGIRIGSSGKGAQSIIPPSPDREWVVDINDCDPAPLPDLVIDRLLGAQNDSGATHDADDSNSSDECFRVLLRIQPKDDETDGSKRLFAWCCRCVEFDLTDVQTVGAIRRAEVVLPFPRAWTDSDILDRLRDAEKRDGVDRGSKASDTGPEPEPVEPYQPFPTSALPDVLADFVTAGANSLVCDESFLALPLLCGLASSVGATRRLTITDTWYEPSVLWGAIVCTSGSQKSGAQELALAPLEDCQAFHIEQEPEQLKQYEIDKKLFDSDFKEWNKKGRSTGQPQPEEPVLPKTIRYVVDNTTIESLAGRLAENLRGLLVGADEISAWLGSMGRYASGATQGEKAQWLSFYRAGRLLHDRGRNDKQTTYVKHAAVSIVGGVPPRTFRKLLLADDLDNGLAARLLIAMPPKRAKRWSDAKVSEKLKGRLARIYSRLLALTFDDGEPIKINLAPEAKQLAIQFVNRHGDEQLDLEDSLQAAWAKLEAVAFRLAMLFSLVRWAESDRPTYETGAVTLSDLTAAIELTEWFCNEWKRFDASFGETQEQADQRKLIEWISGKLGAVTVHELNHGPRRYRGNIAKCELALRALVKDGICRSYIDTHQGGKGRPVEVFELL